ncbi:MAG: ATP-dependent DNA helicase RecG [Trueperaceae bacterium]|nr:ATP-dependent DNA helicase RecG [Trueperaceae bacterium]
MATVNELRERLKRPLERERASGYQDDVVVGGLEKLVATVGRPFRDVQEVIAGYGDLSVEERAERLERALGMLEPLTTSSDVWNTREPDKPDPDRSNPEKSDSDKPDPDKSDPDPHLLDEPLETQRIDLGQQAPKKLGDIGIVSYRDLIYSFPKRYEDRRVIPSFSALQGQDTATVAGTITGRKATKSKRGLVVLRAFLEDKHGAKLTATWFNQPWLEKQLFPGSRIIATGKVKQGRGLELNVTSFELDDGTESLSAGRIVGVYAAKPGLSQAYIRRAVDRLLQAVSRFPDHLPKTLLERYDLVSLDEALRAIHFPNDERALQRALRRLKFDEFLLLELRVMLSRDTSLLGKQFRVRTDDLKTFESTLPFTLTKAQRRALQGILGDMESPKQMARLLQGDVGSGKTAVAAAAMYVAVKNDHQAALMAPTEILARQHYLNLTHYLYPLGLRVDLLLGTMGQRDRREVRGRIASGEVDVVVGTHALIQNDVAFYRLGLAVIDEEHRFGVEQRRKLLQDLPDVLVMSATPIPRSLALTYYGDLELSIIDELPPGRQPIKTRLVNDSKRRDVYRFAWGEIQKGRQAYLVTPLIEESESETMADIVSTTQMYDDLRLIMPPACRIEMLHGKMSGEEKDDIMNRFRARDFDLLVSTTVIEVGVDIPNASLMMIENAERFGLSQLHQLRGRVGRGEHESYCVLIAGDRSKKTQHRLEVIEKYTDGFVIAEKDLELRGPGEVRGTRQSGVPDLVLGDLSQDGELIEQSRELAKKMLGADPKLDAAWAARLKAELKRRSVSLGLREVI